MWKREQGDQLRWPGSVSRCQFRVDNSFSFEMEEIVEGEQVRVVIGWYLGNQEENLNNAKHGVNTLQVDAKFNLFTCKPLMTFNNESYRLMTRRFMLLLFFF